MDEACPVKLFAAVLYQNPTDFDNACKLLAQAFGEIDYISPESPFDVTDYYQKEMGVPLLRKLLSFSRLSQAAALPEIKQKSIEIEERLSSNQKRTVNIDSGYLDFDKVVLASTKKGPYKIYIRNNLWADMTLHYEKGTFLPFSWTFADFKDGRYNPFLLRIRELYKKTMHQEIK